MFDPTHKFPRLEHDGIKVRNLNVHIGDAHILKNVSLDIPKGQITCIIGQRMRQKHFAPEPSTA